MEQNSMHPSLGQRIISLARLAVELHLAMENSCEIQQRDSIGGTDHIGRCTCDGCGHAGASDTHPVTDDALRF